MKWCRGVTRKLTLCPSASAVWSVLSACLCTSSAAQLVSHDSPPPWHPSPWRIWRKSKGKEATLLPMAVLAIQTLTHTVAHTQKHTHRSARTHTFIPLCLLSLDNSNPSSWLNKVSLSRCPMGDRAFIKFFSQFEIAGDLWRDLCTGCI